MKNLKMKKMMAGLLGMGTALTILLAPTGALAESQIKYRPEGKPREVKKSLKRFGGTPNWYQLVSDDDTRASVGAHTGHDGVFKNGNHGAGALFSGSLRRRYFYHFATTEGGTPFGIHLDPGLDIDLKSNGKGLNQMSMQGPEVSFGAILPKNAIADRVQFFKVGLKYEKNSNLEAKEYGVTLALLSLGLDIKILDQLHMCSNFDAFGWTFGYSEVQVNRSRQLGHGNEGKDAVMKHVGKADIGLCYMPGKKYGTAKLALEMDKAMQGSYDNSLSRTAISLRLHKVLGTNVDVRLAYTKRQSVGDSPVFYLSDPSKSEGYLRDNYTSISVGGSF